MRMQLIQIGEQNSRLSAEGPLGSGAFATKEAEADKNVVFTDGTTALIAAAHNGHLEVENMVLEAGADAADADGRTALMRLERS